MKRELLSSFLLTILCILLFAGVYPLMVWGIAQLAPNKGKGFTITARGRTYYDNIGQKFTEDRNFWSRPSAVDYNAAGSGGSNKGPSNPDYLQTVQQRIDTFLAHNPGVVKEAIPADLVTASGSGLDPHISIPAAIVQVPRIARLRGIPEATLLSLIDQEGKRAADVFGPGKVNVLHLNIRLDELTTKSHS